MHSESLLRTVMIDKGQKTARRRRFAATYRNMLFRFSCGRRRQKIPQWKCNVSLHNYISAVAIKLYRPRISFLQLPSGRRRHLFASPLSSFLMLCSLRSGSTRNRRDWRRRLTKKKKERRPRGRQEQGGEGKGRENARGAVGCFAAPRDTPWPHGERSSALQPQLTRRRDDRAIAARLALTDECSRVTLADGFQLCANYDISGDDEGPMSVQRDSVWLLSDF